MATLVGIEEMLKLIAELQRSRTTDHTGLTRNNSELAAKLDQLQFTAQLSDLLASGLGQALPPVEVTVASNCFLPTISNLTSINSAPSLERLQSNLLRHNTSLDELSIAAAASNSTQSIATLASHVQPSHQSSDSGEKSSPGDIPKSCSSDSLSTAEKRKMTHNEIEKRRRDRISEIIASMCQYLPPGQLTGHHESKGVVLQKLHDFLDHLVKENAELKEKASPQSNTAAATPEIDHLRRQNVELEEEKRCLTRILTERLAVCASCDRCNQRHYVSPTSTSSNSRRNSHDDLHQHDHHGVKHHHDAADIQPSELSQKRPKFKLED